MLLFTKFGVPAVLFDADGGSGSGGSGNEKTFTQEEVNSLVGKARSEGRKAHEKDLLEKLGVKSLDELGTLIQSARDAEKANQSELEKLRNQLGEAQAELNRVKSEGEQTVAALKAQIMNAEIRSRASAPVMDKDGKTVLRKAFRPDALDDVLVLINREGITEKDGKFEGVDKALEELAKAKPYLLVAEEKPQPKGTPTIKERKPETGRPSPTGFTVRF